MVEQDYVDSVLVALRRIIRATDLYSKQTMQRYGLTVPQLLVLREVRGEQAPTVGTVAKAVSLSQGTVTSILVRLEHKGLIRRVRSDRDRRCVLVQTTPEGARMVDTAPPLLHDHFITRFRELPEWEQTLVLSAVQRIAAMMSVDDLAVAPVLSEGQIDAAVSAT